MISLWTIDIFGRQYLITSGGMFPIVLCLIAFVAIGILVVGWLNLKDATSFLWRLLAHLKGGPGNKGGGRC